MSSIINDDASLGLAGSATPGKSRARIGQVSAMIEVATA